MAGKSDYAENKVLEHICGKTAFSMPTARVALFTVAPTDAGGGTEVTGGSYARVTTSGSTWTAASAGSISNAVIIDFGTASAPWGNVVAVGLYDAATGGNLLAWAPLTTTRSVNASDPVRFSIGAFVFNED